mmetsp:Transcript_127534/g.284474  ORF Transcript_127534/g.284474 Transcript_127534/m.284474 type:complete len:239 (-) Transcript_127534:54-770(-)
MRLAAARGATALTRIVPRSPALSGAWPPRRVPWLAPAFSTTSPAADVEVLERFRRRAGPELAAATSSSVSAAQLGASLRQAAEEELGAPLAAEAPAEEQSEAVPLPRRLALEAQEAEALVASLEELRRERATLKAERADILAIGFQTTGAENQEFASLVVCATAGIFAVSIHWGFFSIFAVSYAIYRRSTVEVRKQRAAVDDLQEIVDRLREVQTEEAAQLASLQARAAAWAEGRTTE